MSQLSGASKCEGSNVTGGSIFRTTDVVVQPSQSRGLCRGNQIAKRVIRLPVFSKPKEAERNQPSALPWGVNKDYAFSPGRAKITCLGGICIAPSGK
jgi:hypothetical protein